jgi:hypothetical protein
MRYLNLRPVVAVVVAVVAAVAFGFAAFGQPLFPH